MCQMSTKLLNALMCGRKDYWKVTLVSTTKTMSATCFRPGWQKIHFGCWQQQNVLAMSPCSYPLVHSFSSKGGWGMTGISFWKDTILRRSLGNNKPGCCQPRLSLFFFPPHCLMYRPVVSCPLCRGKSTLKSCSAVASELSAPAKPIGQIIKSINENRTMMVVKTQLVSWGLTLLNYRRFLFFVNAY